MNVLIVKVDKEEDLDEFEDKSNKNKSKTNKE